MADGALKQINTAEDIDRVKFKATNATRVLEIAEGMQSIPVIRRLYCRNQMSPNLVFQSDVLTQLLTSLASRAGYQGRFTPYSIQRGHGNILDRALRMGPCTQPR